MLKNEENAKVVDEKCKATSSNNRQDNERGYWIHINHFFNCYPDCKIYLSSFDHFLKRKGINELGLIMVPFSHEICNITNVACCVICSDTKCYMCKNLKDIINGRKSLACSCNEDLKDDHAVTRINWFISNFKMCVTMKERFKPNSKLQLSKQKNDNTNKTKVETSLKESNKSDIKSNIPNVNSECSNRLKVKQCECDKSNIASHSTGIKKKYSKVKTNKNVNNTLNVKESVSSKSLEMNGDKKHEKKPPVDDKKNKACLAFSVNGKIKNSKVNVCESLASDIQILTKDSFSRFVEKYDSLNAFGHQCLFCKILGYFYNGKHCDIIIPQFCIRDRRQTTCDKSANEKDCFGKQYCLSLANTYVEPGMGPKLIGGVSNKRIPIVVDLNYDKNGKNADSNLENPRSKIKKKPRRLRMPSLAEELKKKKEMKE